MVVDARHEDSGGRRWIFRLAKHTGKGHGPVAVVVLHASDEQMDTVAQGGDHARRDVDEKIDAGGRSHRDRGAVARSRIGIEIVLGGGDVGNGAVEGDIRLAEGAGERDGPVVVFVLHASDEEMDAV